MIRPLATTVYLFVAHPAAAVWASIHFPGALDARNGAEPAGQSAALMTMFGFIFLAISGVAALAIYLRRKARHPSSSGRFIEELGEGSSSRPDSGGPSVSEKSRGDSPWERRGDWWKS